MPEVEQGLQPSGVAGGLALKDLEIMGLQAPTIFVRPLVPFVVITQSPMQTSTFPGCSPDLAVVSSEERFRRSVENEVDPGGSRLFLDMLRGEPEYW